MKEQQIEDALIAKLKALKYTYRPDIRDKWSLEQNFRDKFNALNHVQLTDKEFERLMQDIISPDVFAAATTLRTTNTFIREDGTPLHYTLVNIKDWCKNDFEVINQLRINTDNSFHRYDVMLLINGIPVTQIELKTLELQPRKAIEQIVNYKNDPGNGYTNTLLCFMQLFIVSNQTNTRYFANNHHQHFGFDADERYLPIYQFAHENNQPITHLHDFADHFLTKYTLGQMISRYMVLVASEQKLMMMRPYQIYAVKAIVDCIQQNRGNGYIWHTTGSGKTLTSFKASTLLKDNPDIDKCLFVVDRKDLDRQTREEFNKFQAGSVEENTNTATLIRRMLSEDKADKVIVTTIQKLGLALDESSQRNQRRQDKGLQTFKQRLEPLRNQRMVFIFDECHRSQFGDNHQAIKNFFPKAQLFGFTGTPIFIENATSKKIAGDQQTYKTTLDIFEKELHAYTIAHAIEDQNVLKFHIDYFGKQPIENVAASPTYQTANEAVKPPTLPKHVKNQPPAPAKVVEEILTKHDSATNQRRFNAFFATSSINSAIEYYQLFKQAQAERAVAPSYRLLNIACVFSPPAEGNKDIKQIQEDLQQEKLDNQHNPEQKKAALSAIITDYNQQYGTNHSINDFDTYYQDVQKRIKDQQYSNHDYPHHNKIDIVIVVDMLLTGFDSKYLNTLYVDKNLQYHGLIQAFSRTNRTLNATKPHGNILDFRYQEDAVKQAIALFSGQGNEADETVWLVDPAPQTIEQFRQAVAKLGDFMQSNNMLREPKEVYNLKGDAARISFTNHFKAVQKLKAQLDQYTDLNQQQKQAIDNLLPEEEYRAFKSAYLDTAQRLKEQQASTSDDPNDPLQQLGFDLVLFASAVIDYDYIMNLCSQYTHQSASQATKHKSQIVSLLSSYSNFMDRRDDIIAYVDTLPIGQGLSVEEIKQNFQDYLDAKAQQDIATLAQHHKLAPQALHDFVNDVLDRMIFDGQQLSDLLAPLELGWKARTQAELALMADLAPLLKKRAQGHEIVGLAVYE